MDTIFQPTKRNTLTSNTLSTAAVEIERPARYGKQLVNHLRRKSGGEWDAQTESGWVNLSGDTATVVAAGGQLTLTVDGPEENIERLEDIVGRHLVGFARKLQIDIRWTRSDGSEGTRQVSA